MHKGRACEWSRESLASIVNEESYTLPLTYIGSVSGGIPKVPYGRILYNSLPKEGAFRIGSVSEPPL